MIELYYAAALTEIIIPIALGYYLTKRFRLRWSIFLFGAAMFVLSLIRMPLNFLFRNYIAANTIYPESLAVILAALFLSLTAGLFEETARWLGYKKLIKGMDFKKGVLYGAGHGGIESIAIGILLILTVFQLTALSSTDLSTLNLEEEEQAALEAQIEAFNSAPVYTPAISLAERILALIIHISLSVIVLQAFLKKSSIYLIYAIAFHTMVNFSTLLAARYWGTVQAEALVLSFALIGISIIRRYKK